MKIIKGCFKNLYIYNNFIVISCDPLLKRDHCRLIQCSRSNRPIGTVKSLNAPWELSLLALSRDYAKKIDPCRMLVWLGRRTVPYDRVSTGIEWDMTGSRQYPVYGQKCGSYMVDSRQYPVYGQITKMGKIMVTQKNETS